MIDLARGLGQNRLAERFEAAIAAEAAATVPPVLTSARPTSYLLAPASYERRPSIRKRKAAWLHRIARAVPGARVVVRRLRMRRARMADGETTQAREGGAR